MSISTISNPPVTPVQETPATKPATPVQSKPGQYNPGQANIGPAVQVNLSNVSSPDTDHDGDSS